MSPIKTTTQNPVLSENKENQPTLSQKSHIHTHTYTQNKICSSEKPHDNTQNLFKTQNTQSLLSLFPTHKNHNKIIFFDRKKKVTNNKIYVSKPKKSKSLNLLQKKKRKPTTPKKSLQMALNQSHLRGGKKISTH
jgi:hypothetical protein